MNWFLNKWNWYSEFSSKVLGTHSLKCLPVDLCSDPEKSIYLSRICNLDTLLSKHERYHEILLTNIGMFCNIHCNCMFGINWIFNTWPRSLVN